MSSAAAYRQRGMKVVMGGIHPTAVPDEALERADSVVVGEAEGLWEQVVADARAGRLQPIYRHSTLPDFRTPPVDPWLARRPLVSETLAREQ